ncbi:unnamed protein product [Caenorhabditis brenneri]
MSEFSDDEWESYQSLRHISTASIILSEPASSNAEITRDPSEDFDLERGHVETEEDEVIYLGRRSVEHSTRSSSRPSKSRDGEQEWQPTRNQGSNVKVTREPSEFSDDEIESRHISTASIILSKPASSNVEIMRESSEDFDLEQGHVATAEDDGLDSGHASVKRSTRSSSRSSKSRDGDQEWKLTEDQGSSSDVEELYESGARVGFADDNLSEAFKTRMKSLSTQEDNEYTVTRMIKSQEFGESKSPWRVNTKIWNRLHGFQQEGVQWMQKKTDHRSGGILADEMGLGKTIQATVFLRSIAETGRVHYKSRGLDTALIVCHVSILSQWIQELHEWFPKARVFLVHAQSTSGQKANYADSIFHKLDNRDKYYPDGAVVLTTYNVFTKLHMSFVNHLWQVVILDEGHHIRNENTQCSKAMRKLMTPQRFILTGTPFQNRLSEFWKLVDFVHPGRLSDSSTFHRNFTQIINAGANLMCSPEAAAKAYECLVALHIAVKPLILRRLQEDYKAVLNLPGKNEMVLSCELSSRQRRLYAEYGQSQEVADIIERKTKPFIGFNKLGNICNHPGIYRNATPGSDKFGGIKDSGKVSMAFKLFKEWFKSPKNRVIFFTQRKNVISMMEHFLTSKSIRFVSLTGSDSASARPKIIKKFEEDADIKVFLMTTRAGGLGLNLTCANKVLIFDPDWNPQADNQAKNRIYRMGQENNVSIVRLLSNGTIEDLKFLKQVQKENLAAQLLHNADSDQVVPNNTMADLFKLVPRGLDGSEIGVYLPGEIAPNKSKQKDQADGDKKKEKKIMKNKLAGFEDKKLLLSLFDDEKLVAMRQHSISVQNSSTMNRIEKQNMRKTVDNAVGSLIHTEGRLAHTWKQEFHKLLQCAKKPIVSEYFVEEEKIDSYWNQVHSQFKENNDERELKRLLLLAKHMLHYLNNVKEAKEQSILKIFANEYDRKDPTQMYFIHEILSTLGKYNKESDSWSINEKYLGVEVKEPTQNNKRKSASPLPMAPKREKTSPTSDSSPAPSAQNKRKSASPDLVAPKRAKTSPASDAPPALSAQSNKRKSASPLSVTPKRAETSPTSDLPPPPSTEPCTSSSY